MSQSPGEYDPDETPGQWAPGADEEKEKRGDKPPKGKKEKKPKKTKKDRANPDFDDIPGYGGNAFHGDSDVKPPQAPTGPTGEQPPMTFSDTAQLTEDDCKKALEKFVDDQLCYGSKPAKECKILSTKGVTALHYILETFSENRSTKKKKVPYKGGHVDGPENGEAPKPWDIPVSAKKEFKDDKIKKEVPHTAKVKKCKDCKGRGWETCDDCDGWGRVECDSCDGSGNRTATDAEGNEYEENCPFCFGTGQRMCMDCGGDGRVTCDDCEGYRKLKCFIQLKVKFINHDDDYILETTDMPDELVATAGGNILFQQELPMVWPINTYPVKEINEQSAKMVNAHRTKWPNELIHKQRQTLRGVPVTEVEYKWEDFKSRYWVYGSERKVYAPDYPQQCCCGCSII
ncbi:protein SSUH2 homolog isoform X1 [Mercenaria mercenaria]|uniref:protein SSUH2 homolog isoform X1 n=1 Tax=Mercenaria mercenaria TaxID=6596 RepID=UPI00234E827A|nr:protein SSUH2 homolog isoform X1 [Mercenaria mercenaria]